VLVDGIWADDGSGTRAYRPRPEAEMDQLATLVRSAIGYDANRGDQVEVVNMRFAGPDPIADVVDDTIFGFEREFLEKVAANLGLSIVAILFLLLVLKPLVSRAVESMAAAGLTDGKRLIPDQSVQQLAGPGAAPVPAPEPMDDLDDLIDIDKVEGRVKASSIRKIGEIVDKHPEEALSIIRNWMYQEQT
jgi:flagellar M-ring protein FliF